MSFRVAAFPVDTHIHRLAARWGLSSGASVIQTEADLKALFDVKHWNTLHLQARVSCGMGMAQPSRAVQAQ